MALTKAEKAELIKHFSVKSFAEAMAAFMSSRRDIIHWKMKAKAKTSFDEEAMELILSKGGLLALESLMEEFTRLSEVSNE